MQIPKITLHIRGPQQGVRAFHQDVIKIGKLRSNHICLDADEDVSRMHAVIEVSGDEVRLVDLGSTIGTMLNGVRIDTTNHPLLSHGDLIQVGAYALTLQRGDQPVEARDPVAKPVPVKPIPPIAFDEDCGLYAGGRIPNPYAPQVGDSWIVDHPNSGGVLPTPKVRLVITQVMGNPSMVRGYRFGQDFMVLAEVFPLWLSSLRPDNSMAVWKTPPQ